MRYIWLALVPIIAGCGQVSHPVLPAAPLSESRIQPTAARAMNGEWYVDGVHGSNKNDCKSPQHACKTIGHALKLTSRDDSLMVLPAIYLENLNIRHSIKIIGSGSQATTIDGRRLASVFLITRPGTVVTLSGITMRNAGGIGNGGGIFNCLTTLTIIDSVIVNSNIRKGGGQVGFGGGIYNCPGSVLTIINSTLDRNVAEQGGGICNGGTLTIINSTFSRNFARDRRGGAIRNYGTLTIANSTFSGNSAPGGIGGAIHNGKYLGQTGTLVMSSSTVSRNTGGGIFNRPGITATIQNSIVSNNIGGNCRGVMTSNGYNLSSDHTCKLRGVGDLNNIDPKLGPLQYNGGPTATMALLQGSPAIDAGNPHGCGDTAGRVLRIDQRGEPRPDKEDSSGCDIGAYERQRD
jgi:hypothetical protein